MKEDEEEEEVAPGGKKVVRREKRVKVLATTFIPDERYSKRELGVTKAFSVTHSAQKIRPTHLLQPSP